MIYEEEFDEVEAIEEIEEAKANLNETIANASAELAELEKLTDGLEELSEDDEEDVDGGRNWCVYPTYKNISGTSWSQRTSECIQSFTINCGKVKKIQLLSQSRPGMGFAKRGNYLYAVRKNGTIKGTIKAKVLGSINNANVTWTFK